MASIMSASARGAVTGLQRASGLQNGQIRATDVPSFVPGCRSLAPRLPAAAFKRYSAGPVSARSVSEAPGASTSNHAPEGGIAPATKAGQDYFAEDQRPIILFDGVCNMCNEGVNFMLDHDPEGKVRFSALQTPVGRALLQRSGRKPDDISSIVLVTKDRSYIRSEAILRIAQYLNQPLATFGKLGFIVPSFLRDTFYNTIAHNRYNILGKRQMCRLGDARFDERFVKANE